MTRLFGGPPPWRVKKPRFRNETSVLIREETSVRSPFIARETINACMAINISSGHVDEHKFNCYNAIGVCPRNVYVLNKQHYKTQLSEV